MRLVVLRTGVWMACVRRFEPRRAAAAKAGAWLIALLVLVCATASPISAQAPAAVATEIGTVTLTPGWATFGQVVPQGAARDGLKVGAFDTQTDVKTRWPDGSIRFAVV